MTLHLRCAVVWATLCGGCVAAPGTVELSEQTHALQASDVCDIQAYDNHFLTAMDGGGRVTDVIHTNATRVNNWEQFMLIGSGDGTHFGILTTYGYYLTAVGGGGRITDVIHSDATQLLAWEKFAIIEVDAGVYAIQTIDGHYLTAVDSGGRTTDAIHSDATWVGTWEQFRFHCSPLFTPVDCQYPQRDCGNRCVDYWLPCP